MYSMILVLDYHCHEESFFSIYLIRISFAIAFFLSVASVNEHIQENLDVFPPINMSTELFCVRSFAHQDSFAQHIPSLSYHMASLHSRYKTLHLFSVSFTGFLKLCNMPVLPFSTSSSSAHVVNASWSHVAWSHGFVYVKLAMAITKTCPI